jgi:hypothetical protein
LENEAAIEGRLIVIEGGCEKSQLAGCAMQRVTLSYSSGEDGGISFRLAPLCYLDCDVSGV